MESVTTFVSSRGLLKSCYSKNSKINSSSDLATYLLEAANVAVVPGIAFGLEGYFRISYATSSEILTEACNRMAHAISKLKTT